ncbi:MAG: M23 family metallopeptidase [Elusimicrobiota bacterium]
MIPLPLAVLFILAPAPARATQPPDPVLSVEARAFQPGEIILVTVTGNDPKMPPAASLRERALDFFAGASTGTWLAFLGLDLEFPTGPATLDAVMRAPSGKPVRKSEFFNVVDAGFPIVELKVERKFVTPDKNDSERAEAEAAKLHKLFAKTEVKRLFDGRFDSPIPGAATGRLGERRVFNGQPRAPHSGMDIKAKLGQPVRAPAAGKVLLADSLFFAGKTIILDHGLGLTTQYAHLSKFLVKAGDMVKKGQIIGKVGATGRATGPHLHWALKFKNSRIDPYSLVFLDLDAKLKARPDDPLTRSAFCGLADLPSAPRWGKASAGLRARMRPAKAVYAPGERVSLLVEIRNVGKKPAFVDFVRDAALRPLVLGIGEVPQPYETLPSSKTALGPLTEQVKIPQGKTLCFEQNQNSAGPLLALGTTTYALSYDTQYLYPSTSAARAGLWRGRLAIPPATIIVSTVALIPSQSEKL